MSPQLTPREQGVSDARKYIYRQHWKLKWLTLLIAGPMTAYSVNTNEWIPFLSFNLMSWTLLLIASVMSLISLNKLFVFLAGEEQQGTDFTEEKIWSEIVLHTWVHWGVTVILWYWLGALVFAGDLFTLTL